MKTVYFDGVCNLCNWWVRFLTRHDKNKKLQYTSLQSDQATKVFQNHPELLSLKTIVFDNNGKFYTQSDAVLLIFKELGWPYSWVYGFKIIPKFIRNKVYSWVAKNRYRWFGTCELNG